MRRLVYVTNRTALNPFFSDAPQQVSEPGYNYLCSLPISLSRKLNEKQTIKLSYSKRIERPDYKESESIYQYDGPL